VNQLLVIELKGLDTLTQFERVMSADLQWISLHIGAVLGKPTSAEIDQLVGRYASGSATRQKIWCCCFHFIPRPSLNRVALADYSARPRERRLARNSVPLPRSRQPVKFGQFLIESAWSWNAMEHFWTNHFGRFALMKSEPGLPFDQTLAPHRTLASLGSGHVARNRDKQEVRLAGEVNGPGHCSQNGRNRTRFYRVD